MRRPLGRPRPRSAPRLGLALLALLAVAPSPSMADDPKPNPKPQPARAPGDAQVFEHDLAGASFIARPLSEQYEALRARVAALKVEVRGARIDPARAREQVDRLQAELKGLLAKIEATKRYIPAAAIKTVAETSTVPIAPDDLLLVDAEDVEIRGWDRPEVRCVLEKTVLDEDGNGFDAGLAGIELVARRELGGALFGYYTEMRTRPGGEKIWDRFPFPEFAAAEFPHVTLKGLTGEEGNRMIGLKMLNEEGGGVHSNVWRRHAKLVLSVPRCRKVAVRGALGTFRVRDLDAPLTVQGSGNRTYSATYEVANLGGPLRAEGIPIHRLDGIRGDVSIVAMNYNENWSSGNGPDGHWDRTEGPRPSLYRDIRGDLTARFARAELALEKLAGRVDVQNDFGTTTWALDAPLAQGKDHRVVSLGGAIDLRLDVKALGDLTLSLFTDCGAIHLADGLARFEDASFETGDGDEVRRTWQRETWPGEAKRRRAGEGDPFAGARRPADILAGRPRTPGVDVLSRGGIVTASPLEPAAN